jgi:ABC-2 type transport system ATP-binding protein
VDVMIDSVTYRHWRSRRPAVAGATFRIAKGEALGIIGPNGAGKSTLLGCILGFLKPDEGDVRIDGRPTDDLSVRRRTGMLGERPAFPPGMSATDVLAFHHALLGLPSVERRADVARLLERVGLAQVASRKPGRFSHGMRQRLGLACALLGDPQLLLLDEPATGLDPPGVVLLREELRAAHARGVTMLLSSHQLDEVERLCDRVVFMNEGIAQAPRPTAETQGGRRSVLVRALDASGAGADVGTLRAVLEQARVSVVEIAAGAARVEAQDDSEVGHAVAAISAAGLHVIQVQSEASRLERWFDGSSR